MIKIKRYESDLLSSNMYVITENGHAIVIDPFDDISPAEGLHIDRIILTHEHYDHISGVNVWKNARNAPILCSRVCAENIQSPRKNLAYYFKDFYELQTWIKLDNIPVYDPTYSCSADEVFDNEMFFDWKGHRWYLFELPGHSMGSIGIVLDGEAFFSGDSLIANTEISLRLPGSSKKNWNEIGLPRLKKLPVGIRVYPGHFKDFVHRTV